MTVTIRPLPRASRTVKVPGATKHARSVAVPWLVPKRRKALRTDAILKGRTVREWLNAECGGFKGMLAERPQTWEDIQEIADELYDSGVFGPEGTLREDVSLGVDRDESGELLQAALRSSAARLLDPLVGVGLPDSFAAQVQLDAEEIGVAVAELIPNAKKLILKLELMRENACMRWHQDNYVARAIVSYNCSGTEYIHDDYVDFWELNNCGNKDHIIRERAAVCQAGVGDILFMKGKLFPGPVNGLVHKSPAHVYHPNGLIKTRFVLKVDVGKVDVSTVR